MNHSQPNMILGEEEIDMRVYYNILNLSQLYFKKSGLLNNTQHMFANIDYAIDSSTNKCMELLYDCMHNFQEMKKKDENSVLVYEPNDNLMDIYEELYVILIDEDVKGVTPCLYSAITYLANIDDIWNMNWSIVHITK